EIDSNDLTHHFLLGRLGLGGWLTTPLPIGKVAAGSRRCLGDGDHRRTQQTLTQTIPRLILVDHGPGWVPGAFDVGDRLVVRGVEGLAPGLDPGDTVALENVVKRLEHERNAVYDRSRTVDGPGVLGRAFEVVDHGQQVAEQPFASEPGRVLLLLGGPALEVLQ